MNLNFKKLLKVSYPVYNVAQLNPHSSECFKPSKAMNYPNDETGQVLAEMHQSGIDLSVIHDVVFFHLFEQKPQAQAMADYINENMNNVIVNIHPDETPNVWDLDCSIKIVPTYDEIIKQEIEFENIANKFSGYNDGWGIEA